MPFAVIVGSVAFAAELAAVAWAIRWLQPGPIGWLILGAIAVGAVLATALVWASATRSARAGDETGDSMASRGVWNAFRQQPALRSRTPRGVSVTSAPLMAERVSLANALKRRRKEPLVK